MVRKNPQTILLLLLFLLALFVRTHRLGSIGLSEDEARKILATESYRRGDFTANAEHPMLYKLLATVCTSAAGKLTTETTETIKKNSFFTLWSWWSLWFKKDISPEAAVRFPAALAGGLIVLALYFLTRELFGTRAGLIAAALWALDLSAVAYSRIAKEDSLLTLFFLLGNYFLLRGKRFHFSNDREAVRSYAACGAAFGAMFASKYFIPYIWLTLIYYDIFRFREEPRWRIPRRWSWRLYAASVAAFLLLNPIVLSPAVWDYAWKYFTHQMSQHHGYWMMGKIHMNDAMRTYWGVPVYYFPLYFFVKTPILLLTTFLIGCVYVLRKIREDSFLFLALFFWIWLFLISLPGSKFARHVVTILPAVIMMQTLGILLFSAAARSFLEKRGLHRLGRFTLILTLAITAGWYVRLHWKYHPHQSFYVSKQAGGEKRWGFYFPQDEFYDAGLKEAIQFISRDATRNAEVLSTTPAVLEYYKKRFGRPDLQFVSMTDPHLRLERGARAYILRQEYRTYIENYYILVFAHSQLKPLFMTDVLGEPSVVVSFLAQDPQFAKAPYWNAKHWPGALRALSQQ